MQCFPSDFALGWRFNDPKYNELSAEDLNRIRPQSRENSRRLWGIHISSRHKHITEFKGNELPPHRSFRIDWNDEQISRDKISMEIPLDRNAQIVFFWSPSCSAIVDWGTVLKYWDDFFYPDDDNTAVAVLDQNRRIFYSDEIFLVLDQ